MKSQYFLTAVAACIYEDGSIQLANAGHNPVILYRKSSKEFEKINPKGLGIGFNDKGMFEKTLEEVKVTPEKDDILFLYTDGIPDAMNKYKLQFGESKMFKVLENNADKSAEEIKKAFVKELEDFQRDAEQNDDWTMIVVKRKN